MFLAVSADAMELMLTVQQPPHFDGRKFVFFLFPLEFKCVVTHFGHSAPRYRELHIPNILD